VLFGLRAKAQLVDVIDDLAQVVAAVDSVFDLAEDFVDFVFQRVRPAGFLLEALQIGEELSVDKIAQIIPRERLVVVRLAVFILGRGPGIPAVGRVQNVRVGLAVERSLGGFVCFQPVEVFQKQQPGSLLGVVELCGATGFFPEDVVDIFKGLFEHERVVIEIGNKRGLYEDKAVKCKKAL